MKKFFFVLVLLILFYSCQKPTTIEIEQKEIFLKFKEDSVQLKVKVLDKKGKIIQKAKCEFSSDNPSIATVDQNGKVSAVGSGETEIKARYKKLIASVPVKVLILKTLKLDFPIAGVYEAQGPTNSKFKLLITAKDEKGQDVDPEVLSFTSSNPAVATVDKDGTLNLLSDGITTITASFGKTKASIDVPVTILRPVAIKVDVPVFAINVGDTAFLPFTIISSKGTTLIDYPVKIEFEKDGIAQADQMGKVTGLAKGSTKVKISAEEASNTITLIVK